MCLLANGYVYNKTVFTRANKKCLSSHYISIDEYAMHPSVPDEKDHHSVCVKSQVMEAGGEDILWCYCVCASGASFLCVHNTNSKIAYLQKHDTPLCRASMHSFHQLSILERATDHKCINNCNHPKRDVGGIQV